MSYIALLILAFFGMWLSLIAGAILVSAVGLVGYVETGNVFFLGIGAVGFILMCVLGD